MRLTALVTFVLIGRENIVYKIKVLRLDGMILIKNVDAVIWYLVLARYCAWDKPLIMTIIWLNEIIKEAERAWKKMIIKQLLD